MKGPIRLVVLVALTTLIATVAAVPLAAQDQEGFDEFSAGEWFADARAGGTTTAASREGTITGQGQFNVSLEFLVPLSGPTTGSWDLTGSSVFTIEGRGVSATLEWTSHTAEGTVTGDRQRLAMGTSTIRSRGQYTLPGFGTEPVSANDPFGPIELVVHGRLCDDAWGVWIMSWNSILTGEGYSPTFDGRWHAVRQPPEFSKDRMREIASEVYRVANRIDEFLSQAPRVGNTRVIPWDIAWDLIYRAFELINELNNLSLCDQALLGDELERYVNVLTHNLGALFGNLLQNLELDGERLRGETLLEMATMAASVGAIGPGSTYPDAGALEAELEGELEDVMTDPDADANELTAAAAAGEQMGWDYASEADDE